MQIANSCCQPQNIRILSPCHQIQHVMATTFILRRGKTQESTLRRICISNPHENPPPTKISCLERTKCTLTTPQSWFCTVNKSIFGRGFAFATVVLASIVGDLGPWHCTQNISLVSLLLPCRSSIGTRKRRRCLRARIRKAKQNWVAETSPQVGD